MMDLKSTLSAEDLFVSYWLGEQLMIAVGDNREIYEVDTVPIQNLSDLIITFEAQVTKIDQYVHFINQEVRPSEWPAASEMHLQMSKLLALLGSVMVTSSLRERVLCGKYRRLVIFPDGMTHALPIHMIIDAVTGSLWYETFCDGIIYAPSASSYVYACYKRRKEMPRYAVILVGDVQDQNIVLEAENVAKKMPCPVDMVFNMDELTKISQEADILYVATHGQSPESAGHNHKMGCTDSSTWSLLFDDKTLGPRDFFSERIKLSRGAVVVLSACSLGRLMPGPVHEVESLIQAFFYAGAATVLAARWPIFYEAAEVVFPNTIECVFGNQMAFSTAMRDAVMNAMDGKYLTQLMAGPEADTFFWGPFTVFGCGD